MSDSLGNWNGWMEKKRNDHFFFRRNSFPAQIIQVGIWNAVSIIIPLKWSDGYGQGDVEENIRMADLCGIKTTRKKKKKNMLI